MFGAKSIGKVLLQSKFGSDCKNLEKNVLKNKAGTGRAIESALTNIHFLSNSMEYDRGGNFPFDFENYGIISG